jgi:DNA polymerase-3 subunit alpha (Gram-positive type)
VKGKKALINLFRETELPEDWLNRHFHGGYIKEVIVDQEKRTWQLCLHLVEPLDPDIWQEFRSRVKKHFHPAIRVSVRFEYDAVEHPVVLQKYKYFIQKNLQKLVTPAAATWFGQAEWRINGAKIEVIFANPAVLQMARQREIDRHVERFYRRITGRGLPVVLLCRQPDEDPSSERFPE